MEEIKRQLTKMAEGVERFHREIQDLPVHEIKVNGQAYPGSLPPHRKDFRAKFLFEELKEYTDAESIADEIDALVDLIYVAIGALLEMGVNPIKAFEPVQEANMAKLRGETKRGEVYDAVKPPGWTPPDHEAVLRDLVLRAEVRPALLEATKIMLERGAKYNGGTVRRADHFPFRERSVFEAMWLKAIRLRADIENGNPINRDHPRDLINYAGFMIDFLDGRDLG